MQVPRWRNVLMLKDTLIPTLSESKTKNHFASSFHSTPVTRQKWKNKWSGDGAGGGDGGGGGASESSGRFHEASKSYAKYTTRQKRADTKRALRDLLFNTGVSRNAFEDKDRIWTFDREHSDDTDSRRKSKSFGRRVKKPHQKRRRKLRKESLSDDSDNETIFGATFGNKWYTWTLNQSFFRGSTAWSEFGWRDHSSWTSQKTKEWEAPSDLESDNDSSDHHSCFLGSSSDRIILGLPPSGPLKIQDVKKAFHLSALKWHPDKHQGPSQAIAEEKFKLCVNAYKSLCDALS